MAGDMLTGILLTINRYDKYSVGSMIGYNI